MGEYEEKLRDLAEGGPWAAPGIGTLIKAIGKQQAEVQRSIASLPQHWKGQSGDTLLARLKAHANNLGYLQEGLYVTQQRITGSGQYSCSAGSDNQERVRLAREALESLPSSIIPQGVLDAVNQGAKTVEVAGVGLVKVGAQTVGWLTDRLLSGREAAAKEAFGHINSQILAWSGELPPKNIRFDPIPEFGKAPTPVPPLVYDTGSTPSGNFGGPGGGSGVGSFPGGGGGAGYPSYPGGPGGGGTGWTPPGGTTNPGGTGNPGGDGSGGGNGGGTDGNDGSGTRPVYPGGDGTTPTRPGGPSVDSGLEGGRPGFGVGAGLGAAGLGAVGLAAGAKIAGGASGAGFGAGGFGVGVGGAGAAGAGTAGMAGTTGTGAAGAGAGNSGSGAAKGAGAGRPGMMMGGQGGGAADKKGGTNRLGYVAPKFEDEYEENMPHPASRAGKRGE
ncbi:hypothetical protein GCM10020360_24780 [Nonlabens tegetincola]